VIRRPDKTRLSEWEGAKNSAVNEAQRYPFNKMPAPKEAYHRIAARWRFCRKPKGHSWAARGELRR